MFFFFFFILKFGFLIVTRADPFTMVIIYGQPVDYSYVLMKPFSFSSCIGYCYSMSTCAAVYSTDGSDDCIIFEFGQIFTLEQLGGNSGKMMGVKMLSDNSTNCSMNPDGNSMRTGYQLNSTFYQTYTITTNNDIWTFTAGALKGCPANFTSFVRPLGPWCVGVIPAATCISQEKSVAQCKDTYGGVLSGLQTIAERDYVVEIGRPWIPLQTTYNTFGFWVSGYRKTSCMEAKTSAVCNGTNEFDYSDPMLTAYKGYTWANNQPSGLYESTSVSNCLNLYFRTDAILGIDDYRCGTASVKTICYKGYVCGVKPS